MGIEYELKFSASEDIQNAIRRDLGGDWIEYQMRTTYYDTPDAALSERKWTLRRRLENGQSVCTLKTPAGDARREFEVLCPCIEDALLELCKLGAPEELLHLTRKGVLPVCGAAFSRLASTVTLPEGAVEVALDKGVLFAGERQRPLCEVEVELKAGDAAAARAFAQELAAKYTLAPETKSKFKRALALAR